MENNNTMYSYRRNYAKWTKEEDDVLLVEVERGATINDIAGVHYRTPTAIRYRLVKHAMAAIKKGKMSPKMAMEYFNLDISDYEHIASTTCCLKTPVVLAPAQTTVNTSSNSISDPKSSGASSSSSTPCTLAEPQQLSQTPFLPKDSVDKLNLIEKRISMATAKLTHAMDLYSNLTTLHKTASWYISVKHKIVQRIRTYSSHLVALNRMMNREEFNMLNKSFTSTC